MPSQLPIPSLGDFVAAFHRGVKAKRDKREDGHSGGGYDYIAGTSAMLMVREAAFIRDCFRADYFNDAQGQDLTDLVAGRFKIDRILDTDGTGTATLYRANASADAGIPPSLRVIWEGTRILVTSPTSAATAYAVAADTPITAGALYVAGLPIRATTTGVGTAVNTAQTGQACVVGDPLWDTSWQVTNVTCADGTVFEPAPAFRARVVATLRQNTVGYAPGIAYACGLAGAANVSVFGTNFGGTDLHACATYVGDAGFNGSTPLVTASKFILESWRMLGAQMLIGPMVQASLPVVATVQLYDDPAKFDTPTIANACEGAIARVLGANGSYAYDLDALFGAVSQVSDAVQDVIFTTPASSEGLLAGNPLWFPPSITRYQIPPGGIALTFTGPTG
jgi:hypothetical protein